MTEADVEKYLVKRVHQLGGIAYKFVSPGRCGVPDRMVIWPTSVEFVELKAPGRKPSPQQRREIEQLRKYGFCVNVLDSKEAIDKWLS